MGRKFKNNNLKVLAKSGILGFSLCTLCCILPIIIAITGISSLLLISLYLEKYGLYIFLIGVIIIAYTNKIHKAKSCDIDCSCKKLESN